MMFIFAGIAVLGVAFFESVPGYMDADYYYASGLRIANDEGWSELFLWNYLSDPAGLPNPAYTYWMPLAGALAGLGMKVSGMVDFWGARLGFLLLAACLAPLTAYLSYTFLPQRWGAILAGSLAIFSGFYYAYLPTTETFGIYMILGIVIFLLIRKLQQDWLEIKESNDEKFTSNRWQTIMKIRFVSPIWIYLLLGGMTGLMYLTRADGLLWFGISLLAIFIQDYARKTSKQSVEFKGFGIKSLLISLCLCIIGFLMIISPWVLRNLLYFGSVIAPGSSRAIWLTDYDDLFIYPASQLTFERWIETGFIEILRTRGWAFGLNLMSSFAVQGAILLSPLIAV
jgi:hypothetical protein